MTFKQRDLMCLYLHFMMDHGSQLSIIQWTKNKRRKIQWADIKGQRYAVGDIYHMLVKNWKFSIIYKWTVLYQYLLLSLIFFINRHLALSGNQQHIINSNALQSRKALLERARGIWISIFRRLTSNATSRKFLSAAESILQTSKGRCRTINKDFTQLLMKGR